MKIVTAIDNLRNQVIELIAERDKAVAERDEAMRQIRLLERKNLHKCNDMPCPECDGPGLRLNVGIKLDYGG